MALTTKELSKYLSDLTTNMSAAVSFNAANTLLAVEAFQSEDTPGHMMALERAVSFGEETEKTLEWHLFLLQSALEELKRRGHK